MRPVPLVLLAKFNKLHGVLHLRNFARMKRERISPSIRRRVIERDGSCCRYCGEYVERPHLDHVYPVSKGGETTVANLVVACPRCNTKKHAKVGQWPKSPDDARLMMEYKRKNRYSAHLSLGIATFGNVIGVSGVCILAYALNKDDIYIGMVSIFVMWIGIAISASMMWHEKKTR